jgi:hypothetical protein
MLDENLVRLIDQRIAMSRAVTRATGTCITRATTGPGADVMFDGSTVAMPVKVLGTVFLTPGDRCVLDKYGTEWIVTGSFSALGLGEASRYVTGPSGGTGNLSSTSYVDFQEITPLGFNKRYDGTYIRIGMTASCYAETNTATMFFALRFSPTDTTTGYTATDYTTNYIFHHSTLEHRTNTAFRRILSVPAGYYLVQARWRKSSGSGTLKADAQDLFSIEIDEGIRESAPIL